MKNSPSKCTDIKKVLISGNPNGRLVSQALPKDKI
jgi:hypothetical protein